MTNEQQAEFLSWVDECYGTAIRAACENILQSSREIDQLGPLDIVSRAQYELFRDEIEAASVPGGIAFNSHEGDAE